jgi:glyoxylase-like metal-dependent hydrolase (beta-lactamase superfamily II)/rhodanese-related sulfurtransferase
MKIEQMYTGCLAEAAYYIESNGEVAIVDPLREVEPYLKQAEADGATIKYILETHFHADFVSGHLDLAQKTGAKIVYGPTAQAAFDFYKAEDGEVLPLGDVSIVVLHTPGHTMESSTFLLRDENGKDYAIFSGDTLFINDVGRPDLAVKTDLSREDLASHLFDSIQQKILPLADEVIVYPGHGAGSACGKNLGKETWDTLGHQKQVNYALRPGITRAEFVKEVTDGLLPPPQYFPKNAQMNKMGYDSIDLILERGQQPLSAAQFEELANEGALMLDTRSKDAFAKEHIPNSIFIGIDGNFAPWVGALITDLKQKIVLVADPGREEEVVTRLSRVGYDHGVGYLKGGIEAWKAAGKETDSIASIPAAQFAQEYAQSGNTVLDVRNQGEFNSSHMKDAQHLPLDYLNSQMSQIDRSKTYYVHCASGYRSLIAASILQSRGYRNLINVEGGINAIRLAGVPLIETACASTL